jgi:hypothetical protein
LGTPRFITWRLLFKTRLGAAKASEVKSSGRPWLLKSFSGESVIASEYAALSAASDPRATPDAESMLG